MQILTTKAISAITSHHNAIQHNIELSPTTATNTATTMHRIQRVLCLIIVSPTVYSLLVSQSMHHLSRKWATAHLLTTSTTLSRSTAFTSPFRHQYTTTANFISTLLIRQATTSLSLPYFPTSRPYSSCLALFAQPKRGSLVESYQTVSVNCAKCGNRLFRYKKKNGTKSNLVKCFVERIAEDSAGVLATQFDTSNQDECAKEVQTYTCPSCQTDFARFSMIRGLPALKMIGGKVRMTKK
jgi:hypothetical protein